jgi:beta-lactamase regulating signal transducer with metallopeptidase domain
MAVCVMSVGSHAHDVRLVLLALAVGGIGPGALVLTRVARDAVLMRALCKRSETGEFGGVPVRWLDGAIPFVAGVWRPAVFLPRDLNERLAPSEVRAVVLHEDHHRRHAAPRRLLLLGVVGSLFPVPAVRRALDAERAAIEIEADQDALAHGATLRGLAAALLKLGSTTAPAGAGFSTLTEKRLEHLLTAPALPPRRPALRRFLPALVLAVAAACSLVSAL